MLFRCITIGSSESGKSSILARYVDNRFFPYYDPTVGVDFFCKKLKVGRDDIKLQVWDCSGREAFRTITRNYFKGCVAALCVFDLSSMDSFLESEAWIRDAQQECPQNALVCLVGNKSDLVHQVTQDLIDTMCDTMNIQYFEVCAKSGVGVQPMFNEIVASLVSKCQRNQIDARDTPLTFPANETPIESSSFCCYM
jgi:small GTP-binding protein